MRQAAKLIVSVGAMIALLYLVGADEVWAHVRGADWRWLGVAGLCLTAVCALMARRWQIVASGFGLHLGYTHALREYYISQLVNQVLPGGVVGDASRAIRARQAADLKRAALSVVAERALGQLVMFGLLGLCLGVAMLVPGGIEWPIWASFLPAAVFVGLILAFRHVQASATAMHWRRWSFWWLSILIVILLVAGFFASAKAVGADMSIEAVVTVVPLVLTAMLIPLSIGGWGWREGAAAALFPLAGETAGLGVATGIVYGAMLLLVSLPALFLLLTAPTAAPFLSPEQFQPTRDKAGSA